MYSEKHKASITIFEEIPRLNLGGAHLRGILIDKFDAEAKMFIKNSNDT